MSDDKVARLCDQLMLPILIERGLDLDAEADKSALTTIIRGRLKELTGDVGCPSEDFVNSLLTRKRILLILDGLSELKEAARTELHPLNPGFRANAFVVTSRFEERLDNITKTFLHPHRIKGTRLTSFMEAYLNRCGKRALFDDAEFFEGCRRLSTMVGDRDVTVLLAKLYVEQMIAAEEGQAHKDLPDNIPDLMLEYLNRINRLASGMDDRSVQAAAKTVAWECIRHTFRPEPARIDAVSDALGKDAKSSLEYFEWKLRLVQTTWRAARDQIRFTLDPLAEYLAGLYLIEKNRGDEGLWRQALAEADATSELPGATRGFLLAVRDCCFAKGAEWNVPPWVAQELGRRLDPSCEASKKEQPYQPAVNWSRTRA